MALSGRIKNCFVRLDDSSAPAVLEIFSPKCADEDRWGLRDMLAGIEKKEWLDSGLQLFFKILPPENEWKSLVAKITGYFMQKYPDDTFSEFKSYSGGPHSKIVLLHINDNLVLKYSEELRADFVKNFCKIIYNEKTGKYTKIFINTYELGTLEWINGSTELHRWENEDEAQSASYLSKHYTQRILDGHLKDPDAEKIMLGIIQESLASQKIREQERKHFDAALGML
jgi:hypothetical protein